MIRVNGAGLFYEETGTGPQTVLFLHGLLMSGLMWEHQVDALADRYRCVTLDFRGQGRSEIAEAGYDMETLALDVVAFIQALGYGPVHLVGLSMGGFCALRVAARQSSLVRSLVVLDSSAEAEPAENMFRYRLMATAARWFGFGAVASRVMPILFGKTFLTDPARAPDRQLWRTRIITNNRPGTLRAVTGVIERLGVTEELARITCPTLVMVGEEDVATLPVKSERMHAEIRGSRLIRIPGAGHSAPVEQPQQVSGILRSFLEFVAG